MRTDPSELCPACRTIDRADGVEDGRLYRSLETRIGDERRLLRRVHDAQDLAADEVTTLAGSMVGQALGLDPDHVEGAIRDAIRGYMAEGHLAERAV